MNFPVVGKFQLGRTVSTPGAMQTFSSATLAACLEKHVTGDWGDLCEEDKQVNEEALVEGDRLMSAYKLPEGTLWIVTEWDRSVTTFLLPEEY